ncbi:membrane protein, partial [Lasius niger]
MEHSKKFVLLPIDRAQHFSDSHESELDLEMKKLLNLKAPDSEKATLYKQILQKYVKFPEMNAIHPSPEQQQQLQAPTSQDRNLPDIGKC